MTDIDLPTPIRRLLQDVGLETEAPPERRIFTNRDLNLDRVVDTADLGIFLSQFGEVCD